MAALLVAKPVDGWCDMAIGPALQILDIGVRALTSPKKPKEEQPKEEKKEEKPKEEPEKKRSGGVVGSASKRADGCAQRGKTKGRMV
jgi:hypothetical protein